MMVTVIPDPPMGMMTIITVKETNFTDQSSSDINRELL